jgi:hypothetical protein
MDNKLWYIHTMEHYLIIKKKLTVMPGWDLSAWMNPRFIMLSVRSQTLKSICHIIPFIAWKTQNYRDRNHTHSSQVFQELSMGKGLNIGLQGIWGVIMIVMTIRQLEKIFTTCRIAYWKGWILVYVIPQPLKNQYTKESIPTHSVLFYSYKI